jgi:hypothetical protein
LLIHRNGEPYPILFQVLTSIDVDIMHNEHDWEKTFDWRIYFDYPSVELYKLTIKGDHRIQGVIAFEPKDGYIEVHLVESAPHNRGNKRDFYDVGAHLFAFACQISIEFGFDGYLVFTAKTPLMHHYIHALRAVPINRAGRMMINESGAERLIALYLE